MTVIQLIRAKSWGGGEQYALDLSGRLVADGHDVIAVTKGIDNIDSRFRDVGARVIPLPLGGIMDFTSPYRLAKIIYRLADSRVVVHVHTFKDAEIVARARKFLVAGKSIRLVMTRHLVKPAKKSRRWKFIYSNIDCLIFVSRLAKESFLSTRPPVENNKIRVIHNSIIPPSLSLGSVTPASDPDSTQTTLLFTGRLTSEKGLEDLITALSLLRDLPIQLRVAGTGDAAYVESLKELANNKGVADMIEWLGFCRDVYSEIRKADICVAPSVARESFGLTLIEFMSQRKAVIASNHGAQPEIITSGEDGLLIPPHDPQALAGAIRKLATDIPFREEIAKKAEAAFSSRFSYLIFYSEILKTYQPT